MKEGMHVSILTFKTIIRSLTRGTISISKLMQWQMVAADAAVQSWYLSEAEAVIANLLTINGRVW